MVMEILGVVFVGGIFGGLCAWVRFLQRENSLLAALLRDTEESITRERARAESERKRADLLTDRILGAVAGAAPVSEVGKGEVREAADRSHQRSIELNELFGEEADGRPNEETEIPG